MLFGALDRVMECAIVKGFPPKVATNQLTQTMLANDNVLYSRVITPAGRIVKEPTFLGTVLIGVALFSAAGALIVLCSFL